MAGKINSLSDDEQANYLKNTYGVKEVVLHEDIQHNCPLGEQVGVTHYEIKVVPGRYLAELVQLHWDIQKMVGGTYTVESGAKEVLEKVKQAYGDSQYIRVEASCPSNRHMAVDIAVEYVKQGDCQ